MLRKLSVFLTTLTMLACTQINPLPEKKDRIYNAINYEIIQISGDMKKQKTEVKRAYKAIKKISPHDGEYKFMQREIELKKKQITILRQKIRYLELRRLTRVKYVRKNSLEAFKRGEVWSGLDEYEAYRIAQEVKNAPKSWRQKVPVMYDPQSELADDEKVNKAKDDEAREAEIDAMAL